MLVEQGRALVADIVGSVAKFEEALRIDPDLEIEPDAEAKRIYVQKLVEEGRSLAAEGDVVGDVAKFEEALQFFPALEIEPEAEAKRIYAPKLVEEGRSLAAEGNIAGSVAKFKEALRLDPDLEIESKADANRISESVLVEKATTLAQQGHSSDAIAKLERVQVIAKELNSATIFFAICRLQTFDDLAKIIADSCTTLAGQAPTIESGSPVTGAISSALSDPWKLEVAAGSRVTITLSAADNSSLDPYLILYDSKLRLIEEHDDIESGVILDSALYNVALTEPGLYWIAASRCCPENDQGTVGAYVLEVTIKEEE